MKKAVKVLVGIMIVTGLFVVSQLGVQDQASELINFMYDPGGGGR